MSALSRAESSDVNSAILNIARSAFARAIWSWFDANKDRVVVRKWFVIIRLADLRFLIVDIAGPDPSAPPESL